MKKRKIASTIIELLIVIGVFISMRVYVSNSTKPVTVYQYTNTYEAGDVLDENSVKAVEMPSSGVNEAFLKDPKVVAGKKATTKLVKGAYVYTEQLTDADKVDPFENLDWKKLRVVDLPVKGKILSDMKGQKIDLVYVGEATKPEESQDDGKGAYAKVFMQDLLVVNSSYDVMTDEEKASASSGQAQSYITVAATLDQVEEIMARMATGNIGAVKRHEGAQSYDTLGYIIGDFEKKYTGFGSAETGKSIPTEDTYKNKTQGE